MIMGRGRLSATAGLAVSALVSLDLHATRADTLEQALILSYQNNPQLNAQRAATRAVDESVGVALGGYRPRVTATASSNEVYQDTLSRVTVPTQGGGSLTTYPRTAGENAVNAMGLTATQTLFNGFQTGNRTRQAEAQVLGSRETLRTAEQTVLLSAATAYMNLLRDSAILELQRSNVTVLEATLRQLRRQSPVSRLAAPRC
jgi:outer membrane protein